MCKIGII